MVNLGRRAQDEAMRCMTQDTILASVDSVCRLSPSTLPNEVGVRISDFIAFEKRLTFAVAGTLGLLRLMKLIQHRQVRGGRCLDQSYISSGVNEAVNAAIIRGDAKSLLVYLKTFPGVVLTSAVNVAAERGHGDILHMLYRHRDRVCWTSEALELAVEGGYVFVAKLICSWLDMQDLHPTYCFAAAGHGYAAMVKWLWPMIVADGDESAQYYALMVAPLRLAKWMVDHSFVSVPICIDAAAARGDLNYLKWASEGIVYATARAMDRAAAGGHLSTVIWLHKYRTEGCTKAAMDGAARSGRFDVVEWLADHRREGCTAKALEYAIDRADLHLIEFLLTRSLVVAPVHVFDYVCKNGDISVIRWFMMKNLAVATNQAMDWAAERGCMEVVKLLHNRSVRCSTAAMDGAASRGDIEMLEWFKVNLFIGCSSEATDGAAAQGRIESLRWLKKHGLLHCTTGAMDRAARAGFLTSIQWLHENSTVGCTTDAMDAAIGNGHLDMVRWFREHRTESCTSRGVDSAVVLGHFDVLEYLRRNGLAVCSRNVFKQAVKSKMLHEAAWIWRRFPDKCDTSEIETLYEANDWTEAILHHAGLSSSMETCQAEL